MKDLSEVLEMIKRESKFIDIKPHSHNIVGLGLQILQDEFNYTDEMIVKVVLENGLHKKGWGYLNQ